MTGPQHYQEAERLIEHGEYDADEPQVTANDLARAQVHATLALAAATATGSVILSLPRDNDLAADWNVATRGTP